MASEAEVTASVVQTEERRVCVVMNFVARSTFHILTTSKKAVRHSGFYSSYINQATEVLSSCRSIVEADWVVVGEVSSEVVLVIGATKFSNVFETISTAGFVLDGAHGSYAVMAAHAETGD